MTALVRTGYVKEAHASWGIWAVRCGLCPGGMPLHRFQPHAQCEVCGTVTEVLWPPPEMVEGVERLLMMRPDPTKRSWRPGETLPDLNMENAAHGIYTGLAGALEAAPGTALLSVTDNRIRVDALPRRLPNQPRRELSA